MRIKWVGTTLTNEISRASIGNGPLAKTTKKQPLRLLFLWRKVRDSNPRYPKRVYRISSPARSITLPTFLRCLTLFSLFAAAKVVIKMKNGK